ncbi:MAG: serine/threonine-protein kinase, partial [Acidobacteriota bacterium]
MRAAAVTAQQADLDRPLDAGTTLLDRFVLGEHLGRGGFCDVYAARDRKLDESIAVQIPRRTRRLDATSTARFRRGVRLGRRVTHPNVVRIHDVFRHACSADESTRWQRDEVMFTTMARLDGPSLRHALSTRGPFAPDAVHAIARSLADALDAVHRQGIVHRDVHPGNVLMVPDGRGGRRAVLIDFGLACAIDADAAAEPVITEARQLIGTPAYLAPEQICGDPCDARTDQYAWALLLYELLTGTLPFTGDTPTQLALQRLHQPAAPIDPAIAQDLPASWAPTIQRCLSHRSSLR